jgi:hypothetical protein
MVEEEVRFSGEELDILALTMQELEVELWEAEEEEVMELTHLQHGNLPV